MSNELPRYVLTKTSKKADWKTANWGRQFVTLSWKLIGFFFLVSRYLSSLFLNRYRGNRKNWCALFLKCPVSNPDFINFWANVNLYMVDNQWETAEAHKNVMDTWQYIMCIAKVYWAIKHFLIYFTSERSNCGTKMQSLLLLLSTSCLSFASFVRVSLWAWLHLPRAIVTCICVYPYLSRSLVVCGPTADERAHRIIPDNFLCQREAGATPQNSHSYIARCTRLLHA